MQFLKPLNYLQSLQLDNMCKILGSQTCVCESNPETLMCKETSRGGAVNSLKPVL